MMVRMRFIFPLPGTLLPTFLGLSAIDFPLTFGFEKNQTSREIDRALRMIGPPPPGPSPRGVALFF